MSKNEEASIIAKSKWKAIKSKLILIEGWARNGLTDEQIAKNLGISKTTLYKYIKEQPELSERLKKGKEVIDLEVENALLKRALGYIFKEVKEEVNVDGIVIKKTIIRKEVVADTTAQIFWLKNRKPKEWRDKNVIEHEGEIKTNPFEGLSTKELKELIKIENK